MIIRSHRKPRPREVYGARFLLLSIEQHLTVYQKSSKDGYRVNLRQKNDTEKIKFIERMDMIKELTHDPIFLAGKSKVATKNVVFSIHFLV